MIPWSWSADCWLSISCSHTPTLSLTNSVYDLISLPEDDFEKTVADMREEINRELQKGDAWSNDFVNRLDIMDSFIRESLRHNPIGEVGVERTIIKKGGFTFSNGLHIPQGATCAAAFKAWQQDEEEYGGFKPRRSLEDPEHPKITTVSPISSTLALAVQHVQDDTLRQICRSWLSPIFSWNMTLCV